MKPLYTQHSTLPFDYIEKKLALFLKEDNIEKDLSTLFSTKTKDPQTTADLIAEEDLIIAGLPIINVMFKNYFIKQYKKEGDICQAGDILCSISAPASVLLSNERVLLNLIQRTSGIASLTNTYVKTLNSSKTKILDTRKTTPGLRLFEKYAVSIGGGYNHRFDLYDGVMIKDNHLVIIKNLDSSLIHLKKEHPSKKIQIEVDTFNQLELILNSIHTKVDAILLDNMDKTQTIKCSQFIRKHEPQCFIELSGGINLKNILNYQDVDIDGISIGGLTHQASSKNIKFEFQEL